MNNKFKSNKWKIQIAVILYAFIIVLCGKKFSFCSVKNAFLGENVFAADIASGTSGTCSWVIDGDGVLTVSPTDGSSGMLDNFEYSPWDNYSSRIKKVVIEDGVKTNKKSKRLFYYLSSCTEMDVGKLDTALLEDMEQMFYYCGPYNQPTITLNLQSWDVSNVKTMFNAFYNFNGLKELNAPNWNTSNVENMSSLFTRSYGVEKIDISGWDCSKVKNLQGMFQQCTSLTDLNITGMDTSGAEDMSSMFYYCSALTNIDVSSFDTGNVKNMGYMFDACRKLQHIQGIENFDTKNVESYGFSSMFSGCSELLDLDVSNFDTSKATSMAEMFSYCSKLKNLDISNFDTSGVYNMSRMFTGCRALETLNVSGIDTQNVTNFNEMFSYCNALKSLDLSSFVMKRNANRRNLFTEDQSLSSVSLGPDFNFKSSSNEISYLPDPPAETTTGKWVREDGTLPAKTATELGDGYGANADDWAGVWVWETISDNRIIRFDANGGYTTATPIMITLETESIDIPAADTVVRPHYNFTSWNTKPDGSGTSYQPGSKCTDIASLRALGDNSIPLYAQWNDTHIRYYKVNHYFENSTFDGFVLADAEKLEGEYGTQVSPQTKSIDDFVTPETQTATILDDNSLVVDYYYRHGEYTLKYDGNGAETGSVEGKTLKRTEKYTIKDNLYSKPESLFVGWNTKADGSGQGYAPGQQVINVGKIGETVTLYARWLDNADNETEPQSGSFYVQCKKGETIVIPDLPAGAKYSVEEVENPAWWEDTDGAQEGTVPAGDIAPETIHNKYKANGSVFIKAHKRFDGGELEPGMFTFELRRWGSVIGTATNGEVDTNKTISTGDGETADNPWVGTAEVVFDEIRYTEADIGRSYTYTIREIAGQDDTIQYDTHTENVTVNVFDDGNGGIRTEVKYSNDGPLFVNKPKPMVSTEKSGGLNISKAVLSRKDDAAAFDFDVSLTDNNGTPIDGEYKVDIVKTEGADKYQRIEDMTLNSRSENIDEEGNIISPYGQNWGNANIRGSGRNEASDEAHVITIPEAERIHVKVTYGGDYHQGDCVIATEGAHPDYSFDNFDKYPYLFRLSGGNHNSRWNTQEYDIDGDSVTFAYHTDGADAGSAYDLYGYYAVITGTGTIRNPDYFIRQTTVRNGGTLQLRSGETAVIKNLPEGTCYKVSEKETPGYNLSESSGATGVIADNTTSQALFTNMYSADGSAQIELTKRFIGGELTEGAFTFELKNDKDEVIASATNDANGKIKFDPIYFNEDDIGQEYEYLVSETAGDDSSIIYDSHQEIVKIKVEDNGDGTLNPVITYPDGGTFTNMKLSSITVSKTVSGNMGDKSKDFEFTLNLSEGYDAHEITYTKTPATGSPISGTAQLVSGTYTFTLGNAESITFNGIPCGLTYKVTETRSNKDGYRTTAESEEAATATSILGSTTAKGSLQSPVSVTYTNAKNVAVPTEARAGGVAAMAAAGALAAAGYMYGKKKKKIKRED